MTETFTCPYCSSVMPSIPATHVTKYSGFSDKNVYYPMSGPTIYHESCISLDFYKCPKCENYTIFARGLGEKVQHVTKHLLPQSLAKQFPEYIPQAIRNDYEEACAIVNLSPKSSATLARRCLQGMIRDFFEIKEQNLAKSIEKLEGKVPAIQWKVIDGVRRIGNIGAHMEKDINLIIDIDPGEAKRLIKLIEHLLEQWYINRHEQEQLYADIIGMDADKQNQRKNKE